MKKTKPAKVTKETKVGVKRSSVEQVILNEFAESEYYTYGVSIIEDRAIPDFRDGLIPVVRRALWSAYDLGLRSNSRYVKSARVVGDVLGKYHPHGDTAAYEAIVKATNTNSIIPLFDGEGNWGSLSDPAFAAMRYTEVRLSRFSDAILFNPFYVPVIEKCPNFDSATTEPVLLPALLPIVLLNGKFGIAPGAQTSIPSFEFKSVLKALRLIYEGKVTDSQDPHKALYKTLYRTLKFVSLYGGQERETSKEDQAEREAVFKTERGSVRLYSNPVFDDKAKTIKSERIASSSRMEKLLADLNALEGVAEARDDSSTKDKYGLLTVVVKRNLPTKAYQKILGQVDARLSSKESFTLNFTERFLDSEGQGAARMKPMSITVMLMEWVKWRIALERKACQYWIEEALKQIRKLELLILAVDNRKLIIESLDKDLDTQALYEWLAKKLSIKVEEAQFIFSLKVIQLRKLERKVLEEQMKKVVAEKTGLESRKKTPLPHMADQLDTFAKLEET